MPSGRVKIEASARNFKTSAIHGAANDPSQPSDFGAMSLSVGEASTTVEVTAEAPLIDTTQSQVSRTFSNTNGNPQHSSRKQRDEKEKKDEAPQQASANVFNLQRKVAGVLPVRVDVPRAGSSYRFARALVLDEETKVSFNYKTK